MTQKFINFKAKNIGLLFCVFTLLSMPLSFAQESGQNKPLPEQPMKIDDPILRLPDAIKNKYVENFDYPNATIKDLVEAVAKMTGKNFILEPNVRGKISIVGPSKVTIQEAYYAFLTALEMNNLTIVPTGAFLKITFSRNARKSPIPLYTGDYSPSSSNYITRLFRLKYINAASVRREFSDMTSSAGKMYAYTPTNTLIITDTGANIQRIISILKILDTEGYQERMVVLQIQYASATEIAGLLDTILEEGFTDSRSRRRRGKSTVAAKKTSGGGVISKIIADDRTNSLIILANELGLKEVKKIISKLDRAEISAHAGRIHVYYCQYASAEEISKTLNNLVSGAQRTSRARSGARRSKSSTTSKAIGLTGDIKITADKPTNSLVITASREGYESLLRVLEKLDVPRSQVFVEAVFMEVTLDKGLKYQLNSNYSASANSPRVTGFVPDPAALGAFLAAGTDPAGALQNLGGFILGFTAGKKIELDINGKKVSIGSVQGLLSFLETSNNTNVLSRPTIMAMDNEEASIAIKTQVPSSSGTTTGNQGFISQNIKLLDTGIQLKITPQINTASGFVKLKLSQSVSDVSNKGTPSGLASFSTGIQSREANTTVVIPSGETVVIGGLIRDFDTEGRSKVPLVGDIPILGWLFKSTEKTAQRTNLLMFITPHIVNRIAELDRVKRSNLIDRREFLNKYRGGHDAYRGYARDLYNNENTIQRQARIDAQKNKGPEGSTFPSVIGKDSTYPGVVPTQELLNEPSVKATKNEVDFSAQIADKTQENSLNSSPQNTDKNVYDWEQKGESVQPMDLEF